MKGKRKPLGRIKVRQARDKRQGRKQAHSVKMVRGKWIGG